MSSRVHLPLTPPSPHPKNLLTAPCIPPDFVALQDQSHWTLCARCYLHTSEEAKFLCHFHKSPNYYAISCSLYFSSHFIKLVCSYLAYASCRWTKKFARNYTYHVMPLELSNEALWLVALKKCLEVKPFSALVLQSGTPWCYILQYCLWHIHLVVFSWKVSRRGRAQHGAAREVQLPGITASGVDPAFTVKPGKLSVKRNDFTFTACYECIRTQHPFLSGTKFHHSLH